MTTKLYISLIVFMLLILTACNNTSPIGGSLLPDETTAGEHETSEVIGTGMPTKPSPDITVTPSPVILNTSTAIHSPTPSPLPIYMNYEQECFPLSDNLNQVEPLKQNLLMDGRDFNNPIVLLGKDGQIHTLEASFEPGWVYVSASPNHTHFAIKVGPMPSGKSELRVMDLKQKIIARFDWETNWRQIAGWLNDQWVIVSVKNADHVYDSSLLLDIVSGERMLFPPKFPNLNPFGELDPMFTWAGNTYTGVYLHPTLQYVVYPSIRKNGGLSLSRIPANFVFDRAKSYELAYLHGDTGYFPEWSPDASTLAVINHPPEWPESTRDQKELFLIYLDGQVRQLTNFNKDEYWVEMEELSWSPDGKKIALLMFRLDDTSYKENYPDVKVASRLVILDLFARTVTDTCVPGDSRPVWSPDGQFIAVTNIYKMSSPTKGHMYLVDLQDKISTIILDDYVAEAWIE